MEIALTISTAISEGLKYVHVRLQNGVWDVLSLGHNNHIYSVERPRAPAMGEPRERLSVTSR